MKPPEYRCGLGPLPPLTYGDGENPPRADRQAVDRLFDLIDVLGGTVEIHTASQGYPLHAVRAVGDGFGTKSHALDPADPVPALAAVVADLKDPGRG